MTRVGVFGLLTVGVILAQVTLVAQKEWVLHEGSRVLLPLAPVDPRSLMQGDYMALRYALSDEIARALEADPVLAEDKHGMVVIRLDGQKVASFVRIDQGQPLVSDELVIRYTQRTDLSLGAESFFFEEGQAEVYEGARYGELRVASSGASVLVGLCDEHAHPILPRP